MKRTFVMFALLIFATCGCRRESPPPQPEANAPSDNGVVGRVKQEGQDAMAATSEYLAKQKESALAKMREQIDASEEHMQDLKARASAQGAAAREKMAEIEQKWSTELEIARAKLANAKDSASDSWQKAQQELSEAVSNLKQTYSQAADLIGEDADTVGVQTPR